MTRDEFSRCIALIEAYWPHGNRQATVEAVQIWESLLLDLDITAVGAAIQTLAVDGREFPPPPGLVRRRTLDLINPTPGPDQAWAEIHTEMRRVGVRGTPKFTHPLITDMVRTMGWYELGMSENQVADRAHFLRLWDAARDRYRTAEALPPAARQALTDHGLQLPDLALKP